MGSALLIVEKGYQQWVKQRSRSLHDEPYQFGQLRQVDRRLIAGSALFGIRWGAGWLLPGPGFGPLSRGPALVIV
ncbi:DUF6691 family protein, partial [Aeromonas salmonicida]|uniref:DUF6691 family protein n=1 Tax=Aeromonas salmonicida TaxID=645 RepID=UPI003D31111E